MLLMSYTEIADLLTEKWVEVLGWISIPAISTALIVGIIKIITTCINKKINKNGYNEVNAKIDGVVNQVNSTLKEMKEFYNEGLENYTNITENKINCALDKYEESKKDAYKKIMRLNQDLNDKVGELKEKVIEVKGEAQEVAQGKIEEVQEEVQNIVEEAKEIVEGKVESVETFIDNIER